MNRPVGHIGLCLHRIKPLSSAALFADVADFRKIQAELPPGGPAKKAG